MRRVLLVLNPDVHIRHERLIAISLIPNAVSPSSERAATIIYLNGTHDSDGLQMLPTAPHSPFNKGLCGAVDDGASWVVGAKYRKHRHNLGCPLLMIRQAAQSLPFVRKIRILGFSAAMDLGSLRAHNPHAGCRADRVCQACAPAARPASPSP